MEDSWNVGLEVDEVVQAVCWVITLFARKLKAVSRAERGRRDSLPGVDT